jgi:hypothetical protein
MRWQGNSKRQKRNSMRILGFLIVIATLSLTACSSKQEVANEGQIEKLNQYIMTLSAKVDSLEGVIEDQQKSMLLDDHKSLFFSLKRTPCLGTCPVFSLEVYSDGFVKYIGKNYVELIGDYSGSLSPDQLADVEVLFNNADFYAFDAEYNDGRLDIPATIIEYSGPEGDKKVEARTEIPKNFRLLASELEKLIKEIDWTLTD